MGVNVIETGYVKGHNRVASICRKPVGTNFETSVGVDFTDLIIRKAERD
jgi:hypothetical protein